MAPGTVGAHTGRSPKAALLRAAGLRALDVPQLKIVLKELKVPAKAKSSLRPGRSQAPVARK